MKSCPPAFIPPDTDLRSICRIMPGASVGRLAAGERSVSKVKRLRNGGMSGVTGVNLPTEAPRDCAVLKPERTRAEQSGRKGVRVRSRREARAGSGGTCVTAWLPKVTLDAQVMNWVTSQSFRRRDPFKFAQKLRVVRLQKANHFRVLQQFFRVSLYHGQIQHVLPKCLVDCLEILFQ
jgi:hypothetical protein